MGGDGSVACASPRAQSSSAWRSPGRSRPVPASSSSSTRSRIRNDRLAAACRMASTSSPQWTPPSRADRWTSSRRPESERSPRDRARLSSREHQCPTRTGRCYRLCSMRKGNVVSRTAARGRRCAHSRRDVLRSSRWSKVSAPSGGETNRRRARRITLDELLWLISRARFREPGRRNDAQEALLGNECLPNGCRCPSVRAVNRWNLLRVQLLGDLLQRHPLPEHRVDPLPPPVVTSVAEPMREPNVVGGEVTSVHLESRIVIGRRLPIGRRRSRLEVPTTPEAVALGHYNARR